MPFQFRKEAIEEDLNSNFPSQGQGNPPLYYSLSEVVVPTYNINQVAEGSSLGQNLQTAWDFSTGHAQVAGSSSTIINNTGFWLINVSASTVAGSGAGNGVTLSLTDGLSSKIIWAVDTTLAATSGIATTFTPITVFVRSGDSVVLASAAASIADASYRQIADLNGNLVNPLGFSFA